MTVSRVFTKSDGSTCNTAHDPSRQSQTSVVETPGYNPQTSRPPKSARIPRRIEPRVVGKAGAPVATSSLHTGPGRRRFLVRAIVIVQAAIGGALTYIFGSVVLGRSFSAQEPTWLAAASLGDLKDGEPTPVTLRITRQDGYRQVVDRRVVYLSRDAAGGVRALDSTCTHLGCRTRYDDEAKQFVCPCHGGAYDTEGKVVAGPPPQPLRRLDARVEAGHVVVRV